MIEAQESITGTISSSTSINSVINNGVVVPEEKDPTVPSHVKTISEEDIARWNEGTKVDLSKYYTKEEINNKGYITEEQVDKKGFFDEISLNEYIEENKETLRGPQGDKGDTPEFEKEKIGTTLTINDGKKFKVFEIDGASYQETTSGKNLLEVNERNYYSGGITAKITNNGITLNGTATENFFIILRSYEDGIMFKDKIFSVAENLSGVICYIDYLSSSGDWISSEYAFKSGTKLTIPSQRLSFKLKVNAGTSLNNKVVYPMVSDTLGDYEPYTGCEPSPSPDYPQEVEVIEGSIDIKVTNGLESTDSGYQEEIVTIDLQNNFLSKIGDVADELDVVTGKLTKRIGKLVLNGSESYQYTSSNKRFVIIDFKNDAFIPTDANRHIEYIKSSHFFNSKEDVDGGMFQYQNQIIFHNYSITTINDFKTWLASNNVEVYYILAEPYEVQLNPSTIPMEEGKENHYSISEPLVTDVYCKYYTPYRGDDGKTPVKGVDYYTEADKEEIVNSVKQSMSTIQNIEPEEGDNYVYFFPNIVSKGLVDGTYYLTHTLILATDSVENTTDTPNNTTLFTFDNLVDIKEYIDASDINIKFYKFIGLNNEVYGITTENGVITDVGKASPVLDVALTNLVKKDFYTKEEIDNLLKSIQ